MDFVEYTAIENGWDSNRGRVEWTLFRAPVFEDRAGSPQTVALRGVGSAFKARPRSPAKLLRPN